MLTSIQMEIWDLMLIKIQIEVIICRGLRGVAINGTKNRFRPSLFFDAKSFLLEIIGRQRKGFLLNAYQEAFH